jgi:nitroreductase
MTSTPQPDLAAAFEALARSRFSCRAFLPTQVPDETISRLIGIAQQAASWCNVQPWEVIVTSGEATDRFRKGLAEHALTQGDKYTFDVPMPPKYRGIYLERRREAGKRLYESLGIERGDRAGSARQTLRNYELFDAPHALIITVPNELGPYAVLDCGVFVGQLLLAAESLGLGAIAQAALASYGEFIRDFFDVPEDRHILLGVSIGWPDRGHPANNYRTDRAAVQDVTRWVRS